MNALLALLAASLAVNPLASGAAFSSPLATGGKFWAEKKRAQLAMAVRGTHHAHTENGALGGGRQGGTAGGGEGGGKIFQKF